MQRVFPLCALALICLHADPAQARPAETPPSKRVHTAMVGVGTALAVAGILTMSFSIALYYQAPSAATLSLYQKDQRDSETLSYVCIAPLLLGGTFLGISGYYLGQALEIERQSKLALTESPQRPLYLAPASTGLVLLGRF